MSGRTRQSASGNPQSPPSPALVSEWLATAERGDLAALKRLWQKEPRLIDARGRGPYWEGDARAIHYAASRNHRRIVRWLLAHGAAAKPVRGEFDWAPIHFAATGGHREVVQLLLEHGASVDIFVAAVLGDARTVSRMLKRDRSLVSKRGPDGATPLHFAASAGVARVLLAAGANPSVRDTFHHQTVAEWTIQRPEILALLAKAGADVDIFLAAAAGDLRRVKATVARDPSIVNARVREKGRAIGAVGETPLGVAARFGRADVVEHLLANGAQANTDPSPLPGAIHGRNRAIVKRLLDAGADPNTFGPHGHAALHIAAVYGNLATIRLLMSRGARLDLLDKEHDSTPKGWAQYHKHERAAAILRDAG
jgi:ankyrin repeat protein